jgi:hypothetical protein
MLGNDIVDLHDPDSRPETFRPRFDERVFDPVERHAIDHDEAPQARRWAHWAAKEAAYKLARQVDPGFVFAPSRLVARFRRGLCGPEGRVERAGSIELVEPIASGIDCIELRSIETPDWVHVLALPRGADWDAVVSAVAPLCSDPAELESLPAELPVDSSGGVDPSVAVRRLAIARIARDLGIEADRIAIGRRDRIPTVEIDGARSSMAISLSHHGRFVACAMTHRCDAIRVQETQVGRARALPGAHGAVAR